MTPEQAKVLSIKGRTKAWVGSGLLLEGEIEDRGIVELLMLRHQWPCGIIDPYVINEEVDVVVETWGDRVVATVLPFENQRSVTRSKIFTKLLRKADEVGKDALEALPIASRKRSGLLPSKPHPMVETLNRLLEEAPGIDEKGDHHPF